MRLYYDDELVGEVITNHGMTVPEAIDILGIDVCDLDSEGVDWDLFRMEWPDSTEVRHLMNPATGSVDTEENWRADYAASDPAEWNPEDPGAEWDANLSEVRKDENGDWVEVQ